MKKRVQRNAQPFPNGYLKQSFSLADFISKNSFLFVYIRHSVLFIEQIIKYLFMSSTQLTAELD